MLPNFDKWKHLRSDLPNNAEISVNLRGTTFLFDDENSLVDTYATRRITNLVEPNRIPGYVARKCYDSSPTPEGDVKLTRSLITKKPKPHTVPFEFMTWIFEIDGISKSAITQMDRHRMASFLQQSGRWMDRSDVCFVYDAYCDIDDEEAVSRWYKEDAEEVLRCLDVYKARKARTYSGDKTLSRQNARRKLTIDFATGTMLAINTLSLRNMLELRLDCHAEWEIKRCAKIMYDKVLMIAPEQFHGLNV